MGADLHKDCSSQGSFRQRQHRDAIALQHQRNSTRLTATTNKGCLLCLESVGHQSRHLETPTKRSSICLLHFNRKMGRKYLKRASLGSKQSCSRVLTTACIAHLLVSACCPAIVWRSWVCCHRSRAAYVCRVKRFLFSIYKSQRDCRSIFYHNAAVS